MTTATRGRSAATERSDSSPSTTSQPSPAPAFAPSCGTSPPTIQLGSRPVSRSANAIIAAVVVFPCAPATTIERRSDDELREQLGPRPARHRPDTRSRRTPPSPPGTSGLGRHAHLDPGGAHGLQVGRLVPVPAADLGAPGMREQPIGREPGAADADEPDAGGPQAGQARSAPPRSRLPRPASRPRRIASPIAASRPSSSSSSRTTAGTRARLRLGDDDRAAGRLEVARVLRLVVCGHVRRRDEHGRLARRRRPPIPSRRRARARGRTRRAPRRSRPSTAAAGSPGAMHARLELRRSSARRRGGAPPAPRRPTRRARPRSAPAHPGCRRRRAAPAPRPAARTARRASPRDLVDSPHRPPDDPVLRPVAPGHRVGEKDTSRERRREPVRQPEMRVGLGQGRGDPLPPGRVDHRPGDVAAAAEDDVRPPRREDPRARPRRASGEQHRPQLRDAPAGAAAPRSGTGRTRSPPPGRAAPRSGQASRRSSPARRGRAALRRRERRQHVAGRPAGRDHAPELRASTPSLRAMLRRIPTEASMTTRLVPP